MKRLLMNVGLFQIFMALLIVIMVMFVSNYIVHKNSISEVYDEVAQNNALVVKTMIQSIDNSFRSLDSMNHSIHSLPYNNIVNSDGSLDMAKVYDLQKNVTALVSKADFIEDIIVFHDNSNLAITLHGTTDLGELFEQKYVHSIYNAAYWKRFMSMPHESKVFPADTYKVMNSGTTLQEKKLLIMVGGNKFRLSDKHIMFLISAEKWMKFVDQTAIIPGASFIVLDSNRNVILSTNDDFDLVEVWNQLSSNFNSEGTITGKDFEYNFYKSTYNGFMYINKIPYKFKNINSVSSANLTIMITAIIGAVTLSYLLSMYLYRPIRNIIQQLGMETSKGNDIRNIHKAIRVLQLDNGKLREQLEVVCVENRRSAFFRAIDEYADPSESEQLIRKYFPESTVKKQFVMVLIQLLPKEEAESHERIHVDELESRIAAGLKRESIEALLFHADKLQFVAWIGLDQSLTRRTLFKQLRAYIAAAGNNELSRYEVGACVSSMYSTDEVHWKRAFQDVSHGMSHRSVSNDEPVMDAEQIRYTYNMYYPLDKMEKLSNYVLCGRLEDAVQIIEDTFEANNKRNIHMHQMVHVAQAMFYDLFRMIGNPSLEQAEWSKLEGDFLRSISRANRYTEMKQALIKVAAFLAKQCKSEPTNKLNPAFIAQYIELHYMENLYLDYIAEVFHTSPKYFSSYFKKTFDINYVDYLNKVRLAHARELLKHTSYSVTEIGEKTGYLNASTFATTFKKYYGISPSEYRKRQTG